MKRRGIARTTAMAMAAAMILTACGGGNTDQSANAPTGGSAQTATDNGGSGEIKNRYRCGYGRRRCHTGSGRTAGYHIRSADPSRIQHTDGYRR